MNTHTKTHTEAIGRPIADLVATIRAKFCDCGERKSPGAKLCIDCADAAYEEFNAEYPPQGFRL